MSNTAPLLKEIASVKRFVNSRNASAGSCDPNLLGNFAKSLIRMINTIATFGAAEGGAVQEALAQSPYGEDGTADILSAIDRRMSTALDAATSVGSGKRHNKGDPQFLMNWWHYLTQLDWSFLQDVKRSFHSKMTRLVERANSFGLTNPDEKTFKWMLALLLILHYVEIPSYKDIYSKLQDLKQCCESEKKDFALEHVVEFPEHPGDLPPAVFKHAYPNEDEQPLSATLPGVKTVADHIPLRSNSKLLKGAKAKPPAVECGMPRIDPPAPEGSQPVKREQQAGDAEAPTDPDEKLLWLEYQTKLTQLQAQKPRESTSSFQPTEAVSPAPAARARDSITIVRSTEGKLFLRPRSQQAVATAIKDEQKLGVPSHRCRGKQHHVHAEAQPAEEARAAPRAPSLVDLDPYTREAIDALSSRNLADKKAKAAEKAAAKAAKEEAAQAEVLAKAEVPSRGAAAKKKERATPAKGTGALKTEKATSAKPDKVAVEGKEKAEGAKGKAKIRAPIEELSKTKVMQARPKMPTDGANPPPVYYAGGAIYTSMKVKRFRALAVRGDRYSETSAGWGPHSLGDEAKAWGAAVESINKYQKGKHKKIKKK